MAVACRTAAPGDANTSFVRRLVVGEVPVAAADCDVLDTAARWRDALPRLAAAGLPVQAPPCDFATERLLLVPVPAGAGEPIAWTVHDEEQVDVLVLSPASIEAARGGLALLVVPARPHELAVVWCDPLPGGAVERTLAVFAPR